VGEWRPPPPLGSAPGLVRRLGMYLAVAGDAGADVDRFGLGAVVIARGRLVFHGLVIVADDLAARDPGAFSAIEAWAIAHPIDTILGSQPWRVLTVSEWTCPRARVQHPVTKAPEQPWAFAPRAYGGAGPVVGADLGRSFGLMAAEIVERNGRAAGSWEVWLPGWGVRRKGRSDITKVSRHRPPLRMRARRVGWSVEFGPCRDGGGKRHGTKQWRGEFVDVLSAAYGFDADRSAGFVEHGRNLGVEVEPLPVTVSAGAEGCSVMARAVEDIRRLALAADERSGHWFTTVTDVDEARRRVSLATLQSPAGLATALVSGLRVEAPLAKFDLSSDEHQGWIEAFHGGWVDANPSLLGQRFEAAAVDLSSAYPLVAHGVGWWDAMTAEHLERRDVTEQLQVLCDRAAIDPTAALNPATWAAFGLTLAEVDLDGQPLFVEVPDAERPDGRTVVAPAWCRGRTLSLSWFDALAASVLGRRPVRIVRAVRLVPVGRQGGLRSRLPLVAGRVLSVDEDPALALVALRRDVKGSDPTLGHVLHAAVNSLVSGNASRLDGRRRRIGRRWQLVEVPGPHTFFPVASTVTAGARLLLAVLDRQVCDLGSCVSYRDTDSSIIPASPSGGVLGTVDGSEVRVLSWDQLDQVLATFAGLSPEASWPVWKVERGTEDRPLRSVAFGAKRHVEYLDGPDGSELVDWTESGLGGMWADPPAMHGRCEEGGRAWSKAAVARELAFVDVRARGALLQRPRVPWDSAFPSIRRLQVSSPALLETLPAALGARMGSRFLEVPGAGPTGHARGAVALDPGGTLDGWAELRWLDRRSGDTVRVSTDPMAEATGGVLVERLSNRAAEFGVPARTSAVEKVIVTPLSVRYKGRVSGVVDAHEAGHTDDLARFRAHYEDRGGLGPGQWEAMLALAKALPPAVFARRADTTRRTAQRIAEGRMPRPTTTRRVLRALAERELTEPIVATCALDGCDEPVERSNARYCGPTHRSTARKRRQRAAKATSTRPDHGPRTEEVAP